MVHPSSTRLKKPNFGVTITQSKREVNKNTGNDFHAKEELNFKTQNNTADYVRIFIRQKRWK